MKSGVLVLLFASTAMAQDISQQKYGETPKNMAVEVRLGGYYPLIDRSAVTYRDDGTVNRLNPYQRFFGNGSMLLGELEIDRQLYTAFGSLAIAASAGYAEKYGKAIDASGNATSDTTSLQIIPLKALLVYRFDYLNLQQGIPLVPYVKAGFATTYFWVGKGGSTEVADGLSGNGWSYGVVGAAGLMFLLDILDPRLARDFDVSVGVNHTYIFGEFNFAEINDFGRKLPDGKTTAALDLSSRYFMFGLAFEL